MAVIKDIIEGNSGRLTIRGWEFTRVFKITNLTASGEAMLVQAVDQTGVLFGDSHPTIPTAFAIEFDPQSIPNSGNAATVTILYRQFSQDYQVTIGTYRKPRPTTKFFSNPNSDTGDPQDMKLYYTYPSDYRIASLQDVVAIPQLVEIEVDQWFDTFTIERTEFTTIQADTVSGNPVGVKLTGAILTDRMRQFNNTVNASSWNLRPSDPQWVWRLRMSAQTAEDGLAYRVKYEFSYDPNEWAYRGVYIDSNTGEAVADAVEYVPGVTTETEAGSRNFHQFLASNFSLLELI